jgi:biotin carboxylase
MSWMSVALPFDSVMVASRGEIAARILRTVKSLGLWALLMAGEGSSLRDQLDRETKSIARRMAQPGVLARLQRFLKR